MSIIPNLDSLPKGQNLLSGLFGEMVKMIKKPTQNRKDSSMKVSLLILMLLATIFILATEPLKVIFRKRIGSQALDIGGIIVGCALYVGWALLMLGIAIGVVPEYSFLQYSFHLNQYILLAISAFYFIVAYYILDLAMNEHYRAESEESEDWNAASYRGDSVLMERYIKKGWSKPKVWYLAEPRTAMKWGVVAFIVHPFLGLPIIFSAISFWVNEWYHGYYQPKSIKSQIRNMKFNSQMMSNMYNQSDSQEQKFYVR